MSDDIEDGHREGDRVRVKARPGDPQRGIVRQVSKAWLRVETDDGESLLVPPDSVTNYSLAARRAWRTMPKHAGRPRSARRDTRMISVRIRDSTWSLLARAVDLGLVSSRERAIDVWVRERLEQVLGRSEQPHPPVDPTGTE